ncbi:MAG: DUF4340 domain-containing protein [Planctomycetaceae bacterium]|nr:DUF4340 domain-containing protein [Planctomycetaceae bacterium]
MNPLSRTLTFLATAGVSALFAAAAWYSTLPADVSGFSDVGKELFPEFDNVEKATELDVQDFDSQSKRLAEFSVKQDENDLWVIPSHHSYPAEAKDRLAKTATSLMGVRKKAVQSRSKDDWKRYGVVDPAASGSADAEERGTRLTLKDNSGNALVDLIVGNAVENRDGHYYVREPESNTTFIAELEVDLSAKFSDWIEPDLLKTTANNLVTITLDNYSINEQRGTVEKTELLEFAKTDLSPSGTWEMVGMDPETEQLDTSPIAAIATNLADLKIVGVRPKPEGLGGNMQINPAVKQILEMQMQQQGYFIGGDRDGKERLYSNDGELLAGDSNGVQYTLYFGEIARGTQRDIEVGLDAADSKDEDEEGDTEADSEKSSTDEDAGPRRYLLVKVEFNEGLLGKKPIEPVKPQLPEILQQPAKDAVPAKETADSEQAGDVNDDRATATEDSPEDSKPEEPADDCGPLQDEPAQQPPAEDPQPEPEPPTESEPKQPQADATTEPPKQTEATESPSPAQPPTEKPNGEEPTGEAAQQPGTDEEPEQTEPATPPEDPRVVAQRQYDAAMAAYQAAKTAYDRDIKAWDNKVESGQKKADELFARFDRWYYVISSDSFEKFRITRKDVISEKTDEPAGGTPPGGLPGGLPGGGGFPSGIPGGLPPGLIPGGGQ